jgi:predicted secreted protein
MKLGVTGSYIWKIKNVSRDTETVAEAWHIEEQNTTNYSPVT